MSRKTDLAWAAGLFEGEGCVSFASCSVRLVLQMTDRDVVERFAAVVGDGKITVQIPKNERYLPLYRWTKAGAVFARGLLEEWRPYLGERRLARFEEVLAIADRRHVEQRARRRVRSGLVEIRRAVRADGR